mgnify:CR=1 FL=1
MRDADVQIGVVGTKIYTQDVLERFIHAERPIDVLVTVDPSQAAGMDIAGYHDIEPFAARHGIDVFHPETYGLRSTADQAAIETLDLDILFVAGWSRLIPESVLQSLSVGAIGAHGSPDGLPSGRGRAVLNWALINGETEFRLSTFVLEPGVDDGDIIETVTFEITDFDTASTLRYKTWMAYADTVCNNWKSIVTNDFDAEPQSGAVTYYPKREPQDGSIDWTKPATWLHRFVRALTRPYPGAMTELDGERLTIWRAVPFGQHLSPGTGTPGRVLKVFCDGELLVETGGQPLLVTEFEGLDVRSIERGDVFESIPHEKTLAEIRTRYPDEISDEQKEI